MSPCLVVHAPWPHQPRWPCCAEGGRRDAWGRAWPCARSRLCSRWRSMSRAEGPCRECQLRWGRRSCHGCAPVGSRAVGWVSRREPAASCGVMPTAASGGHAGRGWPCPPGLRRAGRAERRPMPRGPCWGYALAPGRPRHAPRVRRVLVGDRAEPTVLPCLAMATMLVLRAHLQDGGGLVCTRIFRMAAEVLVCCGADFSPFIP